MSDTAISSQIVSEISSPQNGSGSPLTEVGTINKTQASEFDGILDDTVASVEMLDPDLLLQLQLQEQELLDLNPLTEGQLNPLLGPLNLATTGGNALPSQLAVNALGLKNTNSLQAQNIPFAQLAKSAPLDGQFESSVALVTPTAGSSLFASADLPLEESILSAQLNGSFTEKNIPDLKQVNAQLFNQLVNQANTKKQPMIDNAVQTAAAPGIMMNQSVSMHSSEAVLPAITVSPENAQWNSQVGDRINWMVNNNMQRVEIRLDPPELGNLDIRLNMAKDNQASILVHVTNATAKEAIESAIPRLREMFEQQGLDLTDVDVSQQNYQQQQESAFEQSENNGLDNDAYNMKNANEAELAEEQALGLTSKLPEKSENLLDIFA